MNKSDSHSQKLTIKAANYGTINQTINQASMLPAYTPEQIEIHRRQKLVAQLRQAWEMDNDGISPRRAAGLEWGAGEKLWVNEELRVRGEDWQV